MLQTMRGKTTTLLTLLMLVLSTKQIPRLKTLESWHTAKTADTENNSKPLHKTILHFFVIRPYCCEALAKQQHYL